LTTGSLLVAVSSTGVKSVDSLRFVNNQFGINNTSLLLGSTGAGSTVMFNYNSYGEKVHYFHNTGSTGYVMSFQTSPYCEKLIVECFGAGGRGPGAGYGGYSKCIYSNVPRGVNTCKMWVGVAGEGGNSYIMQYLNGSSTGMNYYPSPSPILGGGGASYVYFGTGLNPSKYNLLALAGGGGGSPSSFSFYDGYPGYNENVTTRVLCLAGNSETDAQNINLTSTYQQGFSVTGTTDPVLSQTIFGRGGSSTFPGTGGLTYYHIPNGFNNDIPANPFPSTIPGNIAGSVNSKTGGSTSIPLTISNLTKNVCSTGGDGAYLYWGIGSAGIIYWGVGLGVTAGGGGNGFCGGGGGGMNYIYTGPNALYIGDPHYYTQFVVSGGGGGSNFVLLSSTTGAFTGGFTGAFTGTTDTNGSLYTTGSYSYPDYNGYIKITEIGYVYPSLSISPSGTKITETNIQNNGITIKDEGTSLFTDIEITNIVKVGTSVKLPNYQNIFLQQDYDPTLYNILNNDFNYSSASQETDLNYSLAALNLELGYTQNALSGLVNMLGFAFGTYDSDGNLFDTPYWLKQYLANYFPTITSCVTNYTNSRYYSNNPTLQHNIDNGIILSFGEWVYNFVTTSQQNFLVYSSLGFYIENNKIYVFGKPVIDPPPNNSNTLTVLAFFANLYIINCVATLNNLSVISEINNPTGPYKYNVLPQTYEYMSTGYNIGIPNLVVYANYSTGYISGGPDPEIIYSYDPNSEYLVQINATDAGGSPYNWPNCYQLYNPPSNTGFWYQTTFYDLLHYYTGTYTDGFFITNGMYPYNYSMSLASSIQQMEDMNYFQTYLSKYRTPSSELLSDTNWSLSSPQFLKSSLDYAINYRAPTSTKPTKISQVTQSTSSIKLINNSKNTSTVGLRTTNKGNVTLTTKSLQSQVGVNTKNTTDTALVKGVVKGP
jgi:hypothetical protein